MRQPLVAGNWKMNGTRELAVALAKQARATKATCPDVEILLCPPALFVDQVGAAVADADVAVGAQNVSEHDCGAYTGELAASMLFEFGCRFVIVGHSERRQLFGESSEQVAQKFDAAQKGGITPILCIGETQEEREQDRTLEVVGEQLDAVLYKLGVSTFANAVIAYEPVWAIGTGLTATPEQAQQVHQSIRAKLAQSDEMVANAVRIVYGGSVKPGNAEALFSQSDIDGGLIGGASLKPEDFDQLCQVAQQVVAAQ